MKRKAILLLSLIFIFPLVSAQSFGGYDFSLADLFASISPQTIFVLIIFGVSFVLVKTILDKMHALQGGPSTALGLIVAVGAAYGVNRGVSIGNIFSGLGISTDLLMILVIVFLILLLWLLMRYKHRAFLIFGLLLIVMSLFTDLLYEKEELLLIGIVFMIIGLLWWWAGRNKKPDIPEMPKTPAGATPEQVQQQQQIVYKQRQRAAYDMQQKYEAYKYRIFLTNIGPQERKRMLQAMYVIEDYMKKLGVPLKGQLPKQIEKTLRGNPQRWPMN